MKKRIGFATAGLAALAVLSLMMTARGAVTLPAVFGDHMVLQRDMPVPVWGWAEPGETVVVSFGAQTRTAQADAGGRWQVRLAPMPACAEGRELIISAEERESRAVRGTAVTRLVSSSLLKFGDVLVGEVWLGSGQSNMEMGIAACRDGAQEIAAANHPQLRLFLVPKRPAGDPCDDVQARWRVCTPQTVAENGWGGFSGAAYFFGREIHQTLKVPVGLIQSAWGGTRIEPWIPLEGFGAVPALKGKVAEIEKARAQFRADYVAALPRLEKTIVAAKRALKANKPLPALQLPQHPLAGFSSPTGLYNGMIHPLVPFAIRGALWYQGEANCGESETYLQKMQALVAGWRQVWGEGDFPFYYVQLAPYDYNKQTPAILAHTWQAQFRALTAITNVGMAGTVDIATVKDIHPPNKQEVGRRLALWALAKTYGRSDLVFSGPLFEALTVESDRACVHFAHAEGGLVTRDGKNPDWFEVAGVDGKFFPAQAKIDGATVMLSTAQVPAPKNVRYGWQNTAEPNLANKAGLPAAPFASEGW